MRQWSVLVSAVIGAVTIGVGIWQFHEDSERRAASALFEAQKPFLIKQMELCFQATEAAATLASSTNPETWLRAKEAFWVLYWGPLSIAERPLGGGIGPVETQMVEFGKLLRPLQDSPSLPLSSLENESYKLAHKCRELIIESWKIK